MAYPSSLDELTDLVPSDGAAPTTALDAPGFELDNWARLISAAVEAVQVELDTDPSGAAATVKARIAATETVANAALPTATAAATYQPLDSDPTAHASSHAGAGSDPITALGPVTVLTTGAGVVPLVAKGYAGQSANLFEAQDSSGNPVSVISPSGGLFLDYRLGVGMQPLTAIHVNRPMNGSYGLLCLTTSDAAAIDVGGDIKFGGSYSGTSPTTWAAVSGPKESAVDGEWGGYLAFSTRPHGGGMTERMRITSTGVVTLAGGTNLAVGTSTGTKIGTATSQKLGFWDATPVVQQARPTDAASIITLLTTLGLCA